MTRRHSPRCHWLLVTLLLNCSLPHHVQAQPPADQTPADQTLLEVQILMPPLGSDPVLAQKWREVFQRLDVGVRIRQPLGSDDKPDITELKRGPFRLVRLTGSLNRQGELKFPDRTFRMSQATELKEWLNELRVYGAQGSPAGQPDWGLTEDQLKTVIQDLGTPVPSPLKGKPLTDGISQISLSGRKLTVHSSAMENYQQAKATEITDEVQGLSAGTALAYLLSQQALGFRPERTPDGTIDLVIHRMDDLNKPWPVGWPEPDGVPRDQFVPGLFERVRTGINGSPLSAVLDAIETKSGVRILVDQRACAAKKIDLDTLSVSYPTRQTAWALILKSVVGRSHLTLEYRQDEAGTGFTFVAPFASYQPPAVPDDGEEPENRP